MCHYISLNFPNHKWISITNRIIPLTESWWNQRCMRSWNCPELSWDVFLRFLSMSRSSEISAILKTCFETHQTDLWDFQNCRNSRDSRRIGKSRLFQKISGSRVPPNKTRRSWNCNDQTTNSANSYLSREGLSCISPASSLRSLPAWSWPLDIPWERPTCPSCWGRTGLSSPPIARWLFVGYLRQCSYLLVIGMRQAFFRIRPRNDRSSDRSFHRTSIVWARSHTSPNDTTSIMPY